MKKNILLLWIGAILLCITSCHDEEYVAPTANKPGITSITAEILSGTLKGKAYKCVVSDAKVDTYVIPIPWYYPEESDNETTTGMMTSAKLSAELPSNVTISPVLSIVDLTQENYYTLTEPDGTQRRICIKGERTHSSECVISAFEVEEWGISGVIDEEAGKIALLATDNDDLSSVNVTVNVSFHAKIIAPASAVKVDNETYSITGVDLNAATTFTVQADDGTKHDYIVKKELPDKISYGFRSGSEKQLFMLDITSFNHGKIPTLAAVDKYLVIAIGDGSTPKYISRKNGTVGGNIVKGSALFNGSITSDAAGNMLIADLANGGEAFKVYTTNAVEKAPTQLFSWTNTTGFPIGERIAVQGNIKGDALIVAACGPLAGVSDGYTFVYWQVTGGVIGEAQAVNVKGYSWWGTVKVVPRGTKPADGFFFSYYQSNTAYFNGIAFVNTTGTVTSTIGEDNRDFYSSNFNFDKMDAKEFNNASYLGVTSSNHFGTWPDNGFYIYDVSNVNAIAGTMDNSEALVLLKDIGSGNFAGNNIGDVLWAPTSDGYYLQLYVINYTYDMLMGFQVDCINR